MEDALPAGDTATTGQTSIDALSLDLRLPGPLSSTRVPCPKCGKRKLHFCPDCLVPTAPLPRVTLPLHVAVLRGAEEKAEKSTSSHLAVLAPDHCSIHPLPAFPRIDDPEGVLLLFPSPASKHVRELPDLSRFHTVIAVDTTWGKVGSVLQMPELAAPFQHVAISSYHTLFWRYQPMGPTCVSTVEAVYYLLRELAVEKARRRRVAELLLQGEAAAGAEAAASGAADSASVPAPDAAVSSAAAAPAPPPTPPTLAALAPSALHPCDPGRLLYDGALDPLLCLFVATYERIQHEYTESGRAYTSKHRPGYIRGGGEPAPAGGTAEGDGSMGAREADPQSRKRGRDAAASSSSSSSSSATAAVAAQVPGRAKGAWAVRTDVLAPGVAEAQRQRNLRVLENTRGLLDAAAAAPPAVAAAAATAAAAEATGGSALAVDAVAFFRTQQLGRHEYGVKAHAPQAPGGSAAAASAASEGPAAAEP